MNKKEEIFCRSSTRRSELRAARALERSGTSEGIIVAFRRENCERSGWARDDRLFRQFPVVPIVRDFEACFGQSLDTLALETALGSRRHHARMLSLRGTVDLRGASITLYCIYPGGSQLGILDLGRLNLAFMGDG